MENIENNQQVVSSFICDEEIKNYLLETSKWGKFMAIVGYVGIGLLVVVALAVMVGFSIFNSASGIGFPMGLVGLLYLVFAAIYYFPVSYLYKYSAQIKEGLNVNDQQSITSGFENLKSLFKFMGILTIVILSIYALLLVVALPLSMMLSKTAF